MPTVRPQAYLQRGAIAALQVLLALLSGCSAARLAPWLPAQPTPVLVAATLRPVRPLGFQPDPFALALPTPTNTAGAPGMLVTPGATATSVAATATPFPTADSPLPTPTGTHTPAVVFPTLVPPTPTATTALARPTPTEAPSTEASPTPSPTWTHVGPVRPVDTATPLPTTTPTAATPTPASVASPTPTEPPPATWDLAQAVIGMWEYTEDGWTYYFEFLADERVIVTKNGIRPYHVQDDRTLAIEMPEEEWLITVLDLTPERLTLQDVVNQVDHFYRVDGVPDLENEIVGLWLDPSDESPSFEFTSDGITVGDYGRGTYEVVTANSVLVHCDDVAACKDFFAFGQAEDDPLVLRVYAIAGEQLTIRGLGYDERWTLKRQAGFSNLATAILGRWVDDYGSTSEFTDEGDYILDNAFTGSYEVLSDSTVWTEMEDEGLALVFRDLTAAEMTYSEWGSFLQEDLWVLHRVNP